MNTRIYKSCAVPLCRSTTLTTPQKLFVFVPIEKERRKLWFRLAGLTMMAPRKKNLYFCEDHFDMLNDMNNFMEYHIRGSVSRVRMNAGCLPSKFDCQLHRKSVSDMSTPSTDNIQKKSLIEDCTEHEEQNQDLVDQRCDEDSEVPIGCSGCIPSKFDCQPHRKSLSDMSRSSHRKSLSDMSKPSTDNIQRKSLIEDCIEDEEQNQDLVNQRYDKDSEVTIGCSD